MTDCPFTQEQIEWLAERDAALDSNREAWVIAREERLGATGTAWSRSHLRAYTRRALVGFLILGSGLAGAFYTSSHDADQQRHAIVQSGRVVSVDGCNRDFRTVNQLRGVLARSLDFQKAALLRGDISGEQYARAVVYFNEQLAQLPQVDCRPAAKIITDDPDKLPAVPEPLYPSKPTFVGPH